MGWMKGILQIGNEPGLSLSLFQLSPIFDCGLEMNWTNPSISRALPIEKKREEGIYLQEKGTNEREGSGCIITT